MRKPTILSILLVVFAMKMQYTRSLGRFIFLLFSLCCFTAAELLATKSHALAISEFSKLFFFSIYNQTKNSNAHTYEYIDHGTCLSCFFFWFGHPKEKNAYTCITVSIAVTIHLLLISTCMWSRLFKLTACSTLRTLPIPIAIAHALIHYHSTQSAIVRIDCDIVWEKWKIHFF